LSEAAYWAKLREDLPRGHYSRVENLLDLGVPDVSFCVGGIQGWLELKYTGRFPLEHPVLPTQIIWMDRRLRAGGRNIWITVGHKGYTFFIHPEHRRQVSAWPDLETFQDRATLWTLKRRGFKSSFPLQFAGLINAYK
jgi:hypothetical protein